MCYMKQKGLAIDNRYKNPIENLKLDNNFKQ